MGGVRGRLSLFLLEIYFYLELEYPITAEFICEIVLYGHDSKYAESAQA